MHHRVNGTVAQDVPTHMRSHHNLKFTHFRNLLVLVCALALSACAGLQRRTPPTLDQVVQMSQSGMPAEEIVRELKDTRAVYPLSGSQIAKLHDQGVPEAVLDHLQQAYVEHLRWQERARMEDRYWHGPCIGCYYRHPWAAPYFYYPY